MPPIPPLTKNLMLACTAIFCLQAFISLDRWLALWPLGSGLFMPWQVVSYAFLHGGVLANAFAGTRTRFCLVSFDSDWLYPTSESRNIVHALNASGAPVSFVELSSPFGHDSFFLELPALDRVIDGFLKAGGL